ncbi:MAG: hypothetical protein KDA28_07860, partial [Phycisphaerales bacterium]|nr:hypothetical protein [Phycisphaerales bacterium]
ETTLGALTYSIMDLTRFLLGDAESIDATYVEPSHGRGLHALPGESLRDLRGDLGAHLRFPDGRCATLVASDQAGRFELEIHAIGSSGRLEINARGVDWIGPSGEVIDHASNDPVDAPTIVAEALASRLEGGIEAPVDDAGVLSLAQAALLSARTGQPESPATIRRMAGV